MASRKRRLNLGGYSDETAKTEALCGTIKVPLVTEVPYKYICLKLST